MSFSLQSSIFVHCCYCQFYFCSRFSPFKPPPPHYILLPSSLEAFRWFSGNEFTSQCRRHGFYPWIQKIPWRRKWQPTPVFLPGKNTGVGLDHSSNSWTFVFTQCFVFSPPTIEDRFTLLKI